MKKRISCPKCSSGIWGKRLEETLPAYECGDCGGNWINLSDLRLWLQRGELEISETLPVEMAPDNIKPMKCPFSDSLMIKYRFSSASDRYIDYSPKAAGIWLDKGEWEEIKKLNLISSIPSFFSDHWQANIRHEEHKLALENQYKDLFGEHYQEIKELKEKIKKDVHPSDIYSYLNL